MLEKFFGHDITHAIRRTTVAGMLPVIFQIVTVVERDFFPGPDAASRHNPDAPAVRFRLAVRVATVIQETRRIPRHIAVEVVDFIQRENVFVADSHRRSDSALVIFSPTYSMTRAPAACPSSQIRRCREWPMGRKTNECRVRNGKGVQFRRHDLKPVAGVYDRR